MVRRFRIVALITVVALFALAGAAVLAQRPGVRGPRGGGPGFGPGGPQAGLELRALDLTDAQREQVRQLTQQQREQTRALLERARAAREAQRQAVEAIPFNEPQVRAALQALAEVQTELAVQQARIQSDVYALLTPEQQQRLQQVRAEREARTKQRLERMQQRRQGQLPASSDSFRSSSGSLQQSPPQGPPTLA